MIVPSDKTNFSENQAVDSPTAFPEPGTYDAPQMITLLSRNPNAVIHYTRDGSPPTLSSPVFDPYRLVPMYEFGQEVPAGKSIFVIRAVAAVGDRISSETSFNYILNPRARDEYISHEVSPGVRMIQDFENDKMYLVTGSRRALLIDAGMGAGDLRGYIEAFTHNLPVDVVITHGHPDHIAKMGQFQPDCAVYMNLKDLPMVKMFVDQMHYEIEPEKIKDLREGTVFDLGDRKLRVYEVPGHSNGSIVLLDEENGILFSGDAVGSNRPTIVDALWMQRSEIMLDEYLSILQVFRAKISGKVKMILGGHNDTASIGETYLDRLQEAAQKLVDQGPGVLVPSPRPTGAWKVEEGNRLTDPNWASINVNPDKCLTAHPDKIASLSNLQIKAGRLDQEFRPSVFTYHIHVDPGASQLSLIPTATSRRTAGLKINGLEVSSGSPFTAQLDEGKKIESFAIDVTSPDRTVTHTYSLKLMME